MEAQGGTTVHRMPSGLSGIHSDYGLWIFSFGRESAHASRAEILPRSFEFYGISHLLRGRGWLWTAASGAVRKFGPGQAVVSTPGMLQDYGGDGTEYVEDSICFAGPAADALCKSGVVKGGLLDLGPARRLTPIFDIVLSPSRDAQIRANMLLQNLLVEAYFESKGKVSGERSPIGRLLPLLSSEPGRAWTVKEMVEFCSLSESQFRRNFIKETGLHPKAYLDKCRMGRAAELLLSDGASVRKAAKDAGYDDPYHFSRRFKQVMGMPPEQYRERMTLVGNAASSTPL